MRQLYIVLFLTMVFHFYHGQTIEEETTNTKQFGIKAGMNISFIPNVFEEIKESNSKIRFDGGFFANFRLSEKFRFQPEIEYSLRGMKAIFIWKSATFTEGIDVHGDLNINYINFPMMLRYMYKSNIYIGAGAYLGFTAKDYVHIYTPQWVQDQYGVSVDEEGSFDEVAQTLHDNGYNINAESQKYDFGINGELGYIFPNKIGINTRFSQGITKVIKGKDERIKRSPRNQVFFIGVEYSF